MSMSPHYINSWPYQLWLDLNDCACDASELKKPRQNFYFTKNK